MDYKTNFPNESFTGAELSGTEAEYRGLITALKIALAATRRGTDAKSSDATILRALYGGAVAITENALAGNRDTTDNVLCVRYDWRVANQLGAAVTTAAAEAEIINLLGGPSECLQVFENLQHDIGDLRVY